MPATIPASRSLVLILAALAALALVLAVSLTATRQKTLLLGSNKQASKKITLTQGLKVIEGSVADGLLQRAESDVPKIGSELKSEVGEDKEEYPYLPSMKQVLQQREKLKKVHDKEEASYQKLQSAPIHNCDGSSSDCDVSLDEAQFEHMFAKAKSAREAQLLQIASAQPASKTLQTALAKAEARNAEEKKLNELLKENAKLDQQNDKLRKQQKHTAAAQAKGGKKKLTKLDLPVNEATQGNPPGVKEKVPQTVRAPEPGPPDFNGAQAIVARIPHLGFGPSILDEQGVEQRGTFTVRKANPYGGIWFRVYGKVNHPIHCTLRGYRKLQDEFQGNTVFTGFKQDWDAKSSISTGIIAPGPPDNFDIMTCRDKATGEVQHFKTTPSPSPGFFEDPNDPAFNDEYTWP